MQAVILAAGQGERLRPVTDHLAKPLIPFWGRPFLSYVLDNLEGVAEEAIIVDTPAGEVATTLGDRHGALPIRYATQPVPRGTGDALLQAADLLRGPFLLLLGDTCPPRATLEELIAGPGDLALTAIEVDDPENHLGIDVGAHGRIRAIWVESATVDAGVFRFPPEILSALASQEPLRGELRVLQGVARLMEGGADARVVLMP
ncbi:MAG: sugar phosphate nucleotidyltransferase, partial [Armatimonadota bacterium]